MEAGSAQLFQRKQLRKGVDSALKFSISFFSNLKNKNNDQIRRSYEMIFRIADVADKEGFYGIWIPERHFYPFGGLFPNPSLIAAMLAIRTRNLKLMAGSVVLPLHSPVRVAEEWAVVDQVSKGRAAISFATGWNPADFIICPENFNNRHDLMWEYIEQFQRWWTAGNDKNIFPPPYQESVPIYITVAGNKETSFQAGVRDYNLLTHFLNNSFEDLESRIAAYRDGLKSANWSSDTKDIVILLHTYIDETVERAQKACMDCFFEYQNSFLSLANDDIRYPSNYHKRIAKTLFLKKYSPDYSLIGSIESCTKLLDRLKQVGITHISCLVDFGLSEELIMQSLDRLILLKNLYAKEM